MIVFLFVLARTFYTEPNEQTNNIKSSMKCKTLNNAVKVI